MESYTFFQLLLDIYSALQQLKEGTATGGSVSAVSNTDFGETYDEDANKGNLIFITHNADAPGEAPEGEFSLISAYDADTNEFSVSPSFSAAVAAGDEFSIVKSTRYPPQWVKQQVNIAIRKNRIGLVNITQLDTVTGQSEYSALAAWKHGGAIQRIDMSTNQDDANDKRWEKISRGLWEYVPSAPGAAGQIIFFIDLPAGNDLRVWYNGIPDKLNDAGDVIPETIAPDFALYSALHQIISSSKVRDNAGQFSYRFISDRYREVLISDPPKKWGRDPQRSPWRVRSRNTTLPEPPVS